MNLQGACNDMRQPLKVVFKQVIGNAKADRIYSCCLADGSRQKDKGGVLRLLHHMCPRVQCREAGQPVICQDDVERLDICEPLEFGERIHPMEVAVETGAPQGQCGQLMIRQ